MTKKSRRIPCTYGEPLFEVILDERHYEALRAVRKYAANGDAERLADALLWLSETEIATEPA